MNLDSRIDELLNVINKLDFVTKEKFNLMLEKISNLNEEDKIELLKYAISSSLIKLEVIKNKEDKFDCETQGHDFSDWQFTSLSKYDNSGFVGYWKRACKRCNLVDVSSVDPTEINMSKNI